MDFDALEQLWARQALRGEPPPAAALIADMKREVRHVRRRIRGGIVLVAGVLALGWTLLAVAYLTGLRRVTPVDVIAETVGLALYLAFFVRAARSARVVREAEAALGGTLRESLAATLRAVEIQIANARLAVVVIPAVVAISATLLALKHFAGYLRGDGAVAASVFMAALGAAIGGAFWHRCRTQLVPRREELRAMLRGLDG